MFKRFFLSHTQKRMAVWLLVVTQLAFGVLGAVHHHVISRGDFSACKTIEVNSCDSGPGCWQTNATCSICQAIHTSLPILNSYLYLDISIQETPQIPIGIHTPQQKIVSVSSRAPPLFV